jgi:hypothetical protein
MGLLAGVAMGTTLTIEGNLGSAPSGWTVGVTGSGHPMWTVESDATAPGGAKVMKQSGVGTFPWAVREDVAIADGTVEVTFKPISGKEDAAGGVVWRWKDGSNYYVARANALENNVSLYYTTAGRRHTIKYAEAPVAMGVWHTLKVDFKDRRITVALDGRTCIDVDDPHLTGAGAVGVWTKSDSVTAFTGFRYEGQ